MLDHLQHLKAHQRRQSDAHVASPLRAKKDLVHELKDTLRSTLRTLHVDRQMNPGAV